MFFWAANSGGQGGVGILLAEKHVFDVKRPSARILKLQLILG